MKPFPDWMLPSFLRQLHSGHWSDWTSSDERARTDHRQYSSWWSSGSNDERIEKVDTRNHGSAVDWTVQRTYLTSSTFQKGIVETQRTTLTYISVICNDGAFDWTHLTEKQNNDGLDECDEKVILVFSMDADHD